MKTFEYPMALVGWMENIRSLVPTYDNLGDILVMAAPVNHSIISDLKSVSDTIVFDFLIDGLLLLFYYSGFISKLILAV